MKINTGGIAATSTTQPRSMRAWFPAFPPGRADFRRCSYSADARTLGSHRATVRPARRVTVEPRSDQLHPIARHSAADEAARQNQIDQPPALSATYKSRLHYCNCSAAPHKADVMAVRCRHRRITKPAAPKLCRTPPPAFAVAAGDRGRARPPMETRGPLPGEWSSAKSHPPFSAAVAAVVHDELRQLRNRTRRDPDSHPHRPSARFR